jgi:hypothetical protein
VASAQQRRRRLGDIRLASFSADRREREDGRPPLVAQAVQRRENR